MEQAFVTEARCTTMLDKLPVMDRESQRLVDPDRLAHFART
jgi:hypothetical protein